MRSQNHVQETKVVEEYKRGGRTRALKVTRRV